MPKIKITPGLADDLHTYAISLGYRDEPIPSTSRYERYRIQSAESHEMAAQEFIFFYNNDRGVITLYGPGARELLDDFLEGMK